MIVIVSAVFTPEPVVTAMISLDLANELSLNNKVIVLSPPPTRPFGKIYKEEDIQNKDFDFNHIILNSYTCPQSNIIGRGRESYSFGKEVESYIEKYASDIDVVYANTWPLFSQQIIVEVLKKYNIPLVLHIQDIYPESISKKIPFIGGLINNLLLPMDKYILANSSEIITISNRMKQFLVKSRNIDPENINVVRNWQDDKSFKISHENQNNKDDIFTFMYVGSINSSANVELVIDAFGKIDLKNSQLVIAGDGSEKINCIEKSKKYKEKNIQFITVEPKEVPLLQSKADVLILPLKKGIAKTALPSKLTAYMLSSKPVLASLDLDSEVFDIISQNKCGIVCNPEEENELMEQMYNLYKEDKEVLIEMGRNSFSYAQLNLTKKINLSKIVAIINNNLKERNA